MKALLLSAYAASSHVHWQRSLVAMASSWQWRQLSLPPRYFSWRVRGNPLYWSQVERAALEQPWDVLVATSMVDLATLRGLVPSLGAVPALLYFHENQFAYPRRAQQSSLLEAQMVSLYAALAADALAFNSAYNRDSFVDGVAALLARLPDRVPPGVPQQLRDKALVLPVPIDLGATAQAAAAWPGEQGDPGQRPLRLLWSGRFEYDKGGEGLLDLLQQLEQRGLDYELAVTGQQFRDSPPVFARIEAQFSHRLVHFGFIEAADSLQALRQAADMVLSTALHEFQGLAVLEAVACGCLPVVPDRLAYPEIFPARFRYQSLPDQPVTEAAAAASRVQDLAAALQRGDAAPPDISAYGLAALRPRYLALLEQLAGLPG
jgi:glycosyltransferase involved in cell wall biosynthesis